MIRSGFGLFFERTPSVAGVFEEYESYIDTRYGPDGVTPLGPPVAFPHEAMPDLQTSRSRTWDAAYDHRFNANWALHVGVIDRRGTNELIVEPIVADSGAALVLDSSGRSHYVEAEFGVHFTAGTRADLNATYARSQARADLNAFTTFFDSVLVPVIGDNAVRARARPMRRTACSRAAASSPRRAGCWSECSTGEAGCRTRRWTRRSTSSARATASGFPTYFRVDLGVEHRLKVFGHQPWIGVRAE